MNQEGSDRTGEDARTYADCKIGRRALLTAAAALIPGIALARDYGPNAEPVRYPEPDVVVLDKRFGKYKIGNTPIRRLHTGMLWAEGPAWNGVGRFLMWSDIPRSEEHTSELQSRLHLVCRLLLEKKKNNTIT